MSRLRLAILTYATSGELTVDWRSQHQVSGGWKTVSLSEVASGFSYGSAAKSAESGEVPVLRMGNIQDGHIDWSDLVYTSNPSEINKYSLEPGDVLFNRTNSPELVGKTAVYHGEREAIYAGYLIRVRCQGSVLPDFLSYSLNSSQGREYCQRVKSDGVSQSNINAKKLASYQFALPTLAEQHEITARVERLLNGVNELEARYKTVRLAVNQFVPALLALAYRGELVPQDPQDEPASRLLDRIKFARAAVAPIAREPQQFSPIPRAPRERSAMTKSRSDADVYHQPYLARLLRETVQPATVDGLFRRAGLSVSDFYKQLAWEVDQKFINDSRDYLEALQ
ncbi:MAG TPA: restriction endonuclease subunit S [Longimicrobium sp.]